MCARKRADRYLRYSGRLHQGQLRPWRSIATQYRRIAGTLRRQCQGGHRAGELCTVQRDPHRIPRSVDRIDRYRFEYDRSEYAYGITPCAIAVTHTGTAIATAGADGNEPPPRTASKIVAGFRRTAQAATGRAPANERRAAGQSETPQRAKERGRIQEPRDRTGPPRTQRKSRAVGAHVEV